MKIYLDEPVTLYGIKVGHTYEGLKYLIKHYEHILKISTPAQLGDKERQHIAWLIDNYKQHIELYEKTNNAT